MQKLMIEFRTFCGEQCRPGYFGTTAAKGQVAGVQRDSVCSDDEVQTLCCAPGTTMGSCVWEGWRGTLIRTT
jgi:chitinase